MPSGREYVRLYADLASNPKWGRLPMVLRGVWATLLVYAASRNEPSFTVEQATWLLEREGERQAVKRIEALVERRWLDRDGDLLTIHDWHEHQPLYRGPSDDPDYKRQWMRNHRAGGPRGSAFEPVGAGGTEERRGEERRGLPRVLAHEGSDPTPPPVWRPKDEKHLNSTDVPIRDAARKAAEAAGVDWRALLEAKGEKPT